MAFSLLELKQQAVLTLADPQRRQQQPDFDVRNAKLGCAGCPLNNARLEHPKMKPTGPADARIYVIGEGPGKTEDAQGAQFVGKSGAFLRNRLPSGVERDIRWNNIVRCRPTDGGRDKDRPPSKQEIECCRHLQEEDIQRVKPAVVIGMGAVPLTWILKRDGSNAKITAWRGRAIPCTLGDHSFWYVPAHHPSYLLRMVNADDRTQRQFEDLFISDLRFAADLAYDGDPPNSILDPAEKDDGVVLLPCNLDEVAKALKAAMKFRIMGVDIETFGLRPFYKDPRMLSIAISDHVTTYAIPLRHRMATWKTDELRALMDMLRDFLVDSRAAKIAHNAIFEQEWLSHLLGDAVIFENVWHDTMAQAITLDERQGVNDLSDVSVRTIGFDVKKLSDVDAARLDYYPLNDVLRYNAYDAKYEPVIYHVQREQIKAQGLLSVYKEKISRSGPLAVAQRLGVEPDFDVIDAFDKQLTADLEKVDKKILADPDMRAFMAKVGEFRPSSNPKLIKFFGEHLGIRDVRRSVDEEVLSTIKHPVAKLVLKRRELDKKLGTYIEPLRRHRGKQIHADGLIHTQYKHLRTATDRLSSADPNIQNFPRRKGSELRAVIRAPKGYHFAAFDYGQIEARVIAMASHDRALTDALWEGYDIHQAWAEKIAHAYPRCVGGRKFIADKVVMKGLRDTVKNKWTFPLFFGAQLSSAAGYLEMPEKVLAPLYEEFWYTFGGVLAWQQKMRQFYRENGYVETLTGHRRHAPLDGNKIINTPIQGTAAGIVSEAFVELSKRAYLERVPQWQFRMQIHDDLSFYLPESSLEDDCAVIVEEMVRVRHPWVNVPLTVEVKVGTNWANVEEVAVVSSTTFGHRRASRV